MRKVKFPLQLDASELVSYDPHVNTDYRRPTISAKGSNRSMPLSRPFFKRAMTERSR